MRGVDQHAVGVSREGLDVALCSPSVGTRRVLDSRSETAVATVKTSAAAIHPELAPGRGARPIEATPIQAGRVAIK